jgi:integrase
METKQQVKTKSREVFGRIRKLPSTRFQASYKDARGKIVNAPATFRTKTDARAWLAQRQADLTRNLISPNESAISKARKRGTQITLEEYASTWRERRISLNGRGLKPSTLRNYEAMICSTLKSLSKRTLASITREDIEDWYFPFRARSPNQASKTYSHLKTLMSQALEDKLIEETPCKIKGASNYMTPEQEVPNRDQVGIMLEAAPRHLKALIELASFGAFRKGELLELRRKDLSLATSRGEIVKGPNGIPLYKISVSRAVIKLEGGGFQVDTPKTALSIRSNVMPERSTAIIEEHLENIPEDPEALLFPAIVEGQAIDWQKHYSDPVFHHRWQKIRRAAQYEGRFHSLRAFALTIFGESGATTAELLRRGGHSNFKTALRYQRASEERELDRVMTMS